MKYFDDLIDAIDPERKLNFTPEKAKEARRFIQGLWVQAQTTQPFDEFFRDLINICCLDGYKDTFCALYLLFPEEAAKLDKEVEEDRPIEPKPISEVIQ